MGDAIDIPMLLDTVANVAAHNSSSEFMSKLDFPAEPFWVNLLIFYRNWPWSLLLRKVCNRF